LHAARRFFPPLRSRPGAIERDESGAQAGGAFRRALAGRQEVVYVACAPAPKLLLAGKLERARSSFLDRSPGGDGLMRGGPLQFRLL
jgi:hypothetical protein